MDRASSAAVTDAANRGRSVDDEAGSHASRRELDGSWLGEDRPEPGIGAPAARLAGFGSGERAGDYGLEHPREGDHLVAAHHFDKAWLVHHRHLRAAGEEHSACAPAEVVTDEVCAERSQVLGPRHGEEGDSATARGPARLTSALEGRGDHSGCRDGRHRVDGHARRRMPAELPGESCDGSFGAAVSPCIGSSPARAGCDAEDAAVSGGSHERQCGVEHVEVAPEVHSEHGEPVLLGALGEESRPGDACDVHDGVESAMLVDELSEQAVHSFAVGHRHRRGPGRATCRHDATSGGLLRLGQLLGAVEGHEGVDGYDEPPATAELLGNRRSDPAAAAGHDGDPPTSAHDTFERTSSSRPSKFPASSHCSRSSR